MHIERYKPAAAPNMTNKIWEWFYRVLVPAFQSRSVEDIRFHGVTVSGIKSFDDAMKNDWVKKDMTIDQMVELYKRGVPIRVIADKDVKDIYDTVQTHLTIWLERLRVGMNIRDAPIDDLVQLDRFAASVYPHAKYMFTAEALESALGQQMGQVQRTTIQNFFEKIPEVDTKVTRINPIVEHKDDDLPERDSLGEQFRKSLQGMRRY